MAGIERAHGDGGGADTPATVVKRAGDAVGRRALANEAAVLGRVAHPGVVRLVAHTESDHDAQLLTERVPGPTLADLTLDSAAALAAVGAAGAAVVADLHALGIAHGSIGPDHLIVSEGRVVLCSFGRSCEADEAAMDRDVADLVVAIADAARRLGEPATRVGRRHLRRLDELLVGAASRSLSAADLGAALAALAADAGDNHARSSVRAPLEPARTAAHAARLQAPSPDGTHLTGGEPKRPAPVRAPRPWRERVMRVDADRPDATSARPWYTRRNVAIGAAAGLVVVAVWAAVAPAQRDPSTSPMQATPVAARQATPTPSPTAAPTATPTPTDPAVAVVGNLVAIDGIWFEVGRSGDIVRVGDWDCDGTVSPAVLRPGTGEVFVFDGWVEGDETRRAETLMVLADAVDLATAPMPACDTLVVVDIHGRESVVEVGS